VKRTVWIVVGVAAIALAAYLGSRLSANPPSQPGTASPKTKLALLNLKYVVMNYQKWKDFTDRLKGSYKTYEDRVQALNTQLEKIKKDLQAAGTDQAKQDQLKKDGTAIQRQMQDIADEAKNTLGKQEGDEMVIIYREIATAVGQFALSNDIDLVMHYNDATTPEEMNSMPNIQRKMVTGPCIPLYYKPNDVDISAQILTMLNSRYTATPTTPNTQGHN
jgi:Skp family chaperone for outer membrane proteins